MRKIVSAVVIVGIIICSTDAVRAETLGSAGKTRFFRTTSAQDFREVTHADWGDEKGPGSMVIDIDAAVERQVFRGLGGSFAEASCFTLMRLPPEKRDIAFEMLFGKAGLRLSLGRIHCAASDYSMRLYSYDPVIGDRALEHFSIDEDRRWVLPAIREALKVNPGIFFFSSPWSAPGWMKENGTMCGGRLKPDMFGTYADYIVRFLAAYRDEGVVISAHTLQNEVLAEQSFNSPAMLMPAEDEARFVLTLKPKLDAAGLKTNLWILDHNYDLTNHVDAVLATPGVREAISGIAWHSYKGEPESLGRYRRLYPELENIHTEMGPHIDRSKRDFLWWGDLMLRGFNAGQTGFMNWCLALDENGQPNTSCGFPCAGLISVHSKTGEVTPSNQFQAFRHLSPFVDVGATVLGAPLKTDMPDGAAAKRVAKSVYSAFRNPDGRVVVVINHPHDEGAQYMIKWRGRYLPVVLLARSQTTVVIDSNLFGESDDALPPYELKQDGRVLKLESARISAMPFNRVWPGYQRSKDQTRMACFVNVDAGGELTIAGRDAAFPPHTLRPMSHRRLRERDGCLVTDITEPEQFIVDFGEALPPLHVFVNPPASAAPNPCSHYFGPGEHDVGVLAPKSGETVYIDKGAVVYGAIFVKNATDVRIVGRGILDNSRLERADPIARTFRRENGLPEIDTEFACGAFTVYSSTNVVIEGITIRDTPFWSLIVRNGCKNVMVENVKVIGQWRYNSDGFDFCASEDVIARNCFIRSFDDCIVARGPYLDGETTPVSNILVENCVLWCDWGKNLEVWAGHLPCLIDGVTYRKNKLIGVASLPCDVTCWYGSTNTIIRNVVMEDLEIDLDGDWSEHVYQKSDSQKFVRRPL